MKKLLFVLLTCLISTASFASSILIETFEYGNHDLEKPVGWVCDDNSWLAGYLTKDHNRIPHTYNWYAFTNANDSWMFMNSFMSGDLKYRFYFWAISDGEYDVEFWAGNGPSISEMSTLLFSENVNTDTYQHFSNYIENLPSDYQYFGIHAIAHEGAYHLTIDDIVVDMVDRYDLNVTPARFDATMMPGSRITIEYDVQNTGFEDLYVTMTPHTEYFSDIQFTEDNISNTSFPTVPNQTVHCSCSATLNPDIPIGSYVWVDIMFTVSCDCLTRMITLWVTAGQPAGVNEQASTMKIFPNPVLDYLTVKAEGLQQVELKDALGRSLSIHHAESDEIQLNMSDLAKGIYFVTVVTSSGIRTEKISKKS